MCNKYLVTYLLKRGLGNQNGDGNINGNLKKFDSGLKHTTTIINCLFINIFFNALSPASGRERECTLHKCRFRCRLCCDCVLLKIIREISFGISGF